MFCNNYLTTQLLWLW